MCVQEQSAPSLMCWKVMQDRSCCIMLLCCFSYWYMTIPLNLLICWSSSSLKNMKTSSFLSLYCGVRVHNTVFLWNRLSFEIAAETQLVYCRSPVSLFSYAVSLHFRCTAAIPGVQLPFHLTAGLCLLLHKLQVSPESTPQGLCPSDHDQPTAHEGGSAAALHPTTAFPGQWEDAPSTIQMAPEELRHGASPHSTGLGFKSEWAIEPCSLNSQAFTFCAVTPLHFFFEAGNYFLFNPLFIFIAKEIISWNEVSKLGFSFSFEPLFHCLLLALIGGICFPIMTATYLFKPAKIDLIPLRTFTVTQCSPVFSICIFSFTSIFPMSFSKYTEFSKGTCRIITDPAVGGKSSFLSLLLHCSFEHHRVVLNFLSWHFILSDESSVFTLFTLSPSTMTHSVFPFKPRMDFEFVVIHKGLYSLLQITLVRFILNITWYL